MRRPLANNLQPITAPRIAPRTIAIRNAHPRLKVPRAAVARMIALLDERFEILPADLPHLVRPRSRLSALKSGFGNPPSSLRIPHSAVPPGELSLVFLTDSALARIHADFMDDPSATDVITFEGDPAAGLAGEICVSADTAWHYVGARPARARRRARGTPLQPAFAAELTLYLVHGWLHLAGYDDLRPTRKRRMRAAEARAMKILTDANAIPAFRLRTAPRHPLRHPERSEGSKGMPARTHPRPTRLDPSLRSG